MCLTMDQNITFDDLGDDIRELLKFESEENFTMKWIDEEGKCFYF